MKRGVAREARHGSIATAAALYALCALAACSAPPVRWGEVTYPPVSAATASPELQETARTAARSVPAGACPGSLRVAAVGSDAYATWWHVRVDSSAVLMAGHSADAGRSWSSVVPVDSTDRSRRGCDRPAPAIFADSARGYLDLAYFLEASEGAGIFYTHSIDARRMGQGDGVFHSPVAIVYGDNPSRVSVAAEGDHVAVAYEDPNAARPLIGVALSNTMGHVFETRSDVSSTDLPAVDPHVALSGDRVTVQWSERPYSVKTGGRVAVRRGEWK